MKGLGLWIAVVAAVLILPEVLKKSAAPVMTQAQATQTAQRLYPSATPKQAAAVVANLMASGSPTGTAYEPAYTPIGSVYEQLQSGYMDPIVVGAYTSGQIAAYGEALGVYY